MPKLAEVRKALAAVSAAVAEAVALGLLDGTAEKWTTGVLAVVGAALVYYIPNSDPQPPHIVVNPPVADVDPGPHFPAEGSTTMQSSDSQ